MGKTSKKQLLKVVTTLVDNLPEEGVENFDSEIAQAIIDGRQTSGREFMRFLNNRARLHVVGVHTIDCSVGPFVPKGWSVEAHRRIGDFVWDPDKVSLYLSDSQKNGKTIKGNKLRGELKDKPVLNANVLDYLLAHPELIPEEWKDKYVFFWGTIYSAGDLHVRFLYWDGKRWYWNYFWLDNDWDGNYPAAVSAGA